MSGINPPDGIKGGKGVFRTESPGKTREGRLCEPALLDIMGALVPPFLPPGTPVGIEGDFMRIALTSQEKKVLGFIALMVLLGLAVLTFKWLTR